MSYWTAGPWRCRRYAALKCRNYLPVDTASSLKENIRLQLEPRTRTVFIIRKGLAINMRESCLISGLSRPSSPKLRHREVFFVGVEKSSSIRSRSGASFYSWPGSQSLPHSSFPECQQRCSEIPGSLWFVTPWPVHSTHWFRPRDNKW